MRLWRVIRRLGFGLGLALAALPGAALPGAEALAAADERDDTAEEIRTFILGNAMFTLYHEIGHALIHDLDLPVLGREEDAVDNLASLMMAPDDDQPELAAMALAAAQGWLMAESQRDEDDDLAFWDEHGLDMQRFYAVVCMLYGSNPEMFEPFADAAELPDYRKESCPGEYEQAGASWALLLDPHMSGDDGERGEAVRVSYGKAPARHRHLAALVRESRIIEDVAEDLEASLLLPRPLDIRIESCDEANAYYDPDAATVTLCYELLETFEEMIVADLTENGASR